MILILLRFISYFASILFAIGITPFLNHDRSESRIIKFIETKGADRLRYDDCKYKTKIDRTNEWLITNAPYIQFSNMWSFFNIPEDLKAELILKNMY